MVSSIECSANDYVKYWDAVYAIDADGKVETTELLKRYSHLSITKIRQIKKEIKEVK